MKGTRNGQARDEGGALGGTDVFRVAWPKGGYPGTKPEDVAIPATDPGGEQERLREWQSQHNRLWIALGGSTLFNLALLGAMIAQTVKFKPGIKYVTLQGGYVVAWDGDKDPAIDGVQYTPARMRALVQSFVESRYEYDWQNIEKIYTALNLMTPEAKQEEMQKLRDLSPGTNILAPRLKVALRPDWTHFDVEAQGKGVFAVRVGGTAKINNLTRFPDPNRPLEKPFEIKLVVRSVRATDQNPLGYVVVSTTPKDPVL